MNGTHLAVGGAAVTGLTGLIVWLTALTGHPMDAATAADVSGLLVMLLGAKIGIPTATPPQNNTTETAKSP